LLVALPVCAANHYVLPSPGTGAKNGADWNNACSDFTGSCAPGSLVRGDFYYVGAGTFNSENWNAPDSGTLVISIVKATAANSSSVAGWNSSYAAQATFTQRNIISTDYWLFDGQVGDYWASGIGSYGFKEQYSVGVYATTPQTTGAAFQTNGSNITIQYWDCSGYLGTGEYDYPGQAKCIELYGGNNITIQYMAMHGCESCMQGGGNNILVQYVNIYNARSNATNYHENTVCYCSEVNGFTFRYSKVWEFEAEGLFLTGYTGSVSNIYMYGNVFWDNPSDSYPNYPRGLEVREGYSYSNVYAYNNTFYNLTWGIDDLTASEGGSCTTCVATDNVMVDSTYLQGNFTGVSNTVDSNTSRFTSVATYPNYNFQLVTDVAGTALASPYNYDMLGNLRGSPDWSGGAYQYESGGTTKPLPPTNLTAIVH